MAARGNRLFAMDVMRRRNVIVLRAVRRSAKLGQDERTAELARFSVHADPSIDDRDLRDGATANAYV